MMIYVYVCLYIYYIILYYIILYYITLYYIILYFYIIFFIYILYHIYIYPYATRFLQYPTPHCQEPGFRVKVSPLLGWGRGDQAWDGAPFSSPYWRCLKNTGDVQIAKVLHI